MFKKKEKSKEEPFDGLLSDPGPVWGEPLTHSGGSSLPKDGNLTKIFHPEGLGSLEDMVKAAKLSSFSTVVPVDRKDSMTINIPVLNRYQQFSELQFTVGGHYLSTSRSIPHKMDDLLYRLLLSSVDDEHKVPLPDTFTHIEAVHTALRDAHNRKLSNYALILSEGVADALNETEDAVKDIVNYGAGDAMSYAGVPILTSSHVKAGEMYVINKETSIIGFRDMEVKEAEQVGVGATFTPDALVYGAANGCHFVRYEFSEDTNDYCLDCDTCGYSYWAGTADECLERLRDHTEDKVHFVTRAVWP